MCIKMQTFSTIQSHHKSLHYPCLAEKAVLTKRITDTGYEIVPDPQNVCRAGQSISDGSRKVVEKWVVCLGPR